MVDPEEDEEGMDEFVKLLKEFRPEIGELVRGWVDSMKVGPKYALARMGLSCSVILVVIFVFVYLGVEGVISGDAVAFLMGVVVTYVFGLLREYRITVR